MAGASITFDSQVVLDTLRRAADAIDDPELVLMDVGEYLLIAHQARFDAQISPDGTPWAALRPRYARRKARLRPGKPILQFDGLLRGTMRYSVDEGTLRFGTDRPYGARQQFGDGLGDSGIIARPWLGVSSSDEDQILQLALKYLARPFDGEM